MTLLSAKEWFDCLSLRNTVGTAEDLLEVVRRPDTLDAVLTYSSLH